MELPINLQPKVKTYLHHAIINSIIDSPELIRARVLNYMDFIWTVQTKYTDIHFEGEDFFVTSQNDKQNAGKINFFRECKEEDSLTVHVGFLKNVQRGASVNLYIGIPTKRNGFTGKTFRLCVHQFGATTFLGEKHRQDQVWDMNEVSWYKIVREKNAFSCYVSCDGVSWNVVERIELTFAAADNVMIGLCCNKLTNVEYQNWLAMNYIQLYYDKDDYIGGVFLDYRMNPIKNYHYEYRNADQFLETSYINMREVYDFFPDIVSYIKKCIKHRYCLSISLDEFYVPQRKSYQKEHFFHHNVFYGYDETEDSFLVLGYSDKLILSKVSADVIGRMELNEVSSIIRYKREFNKNVCKLDLKNMLFQLENFYYGRDFSYMSNSLTDTPGVFGLKIFDELRNTSRGRELLYNDVRVSYILFEHALLMRERVLHLNDFCFKGKRIKAELEENVCKLMKTAEMLKNAVVKNSMKGEGQEGILKRLDELYELEERFTYHLIVRIREVIP